MQFRCLYVAQIIAFITARKFRDCVKGSTLRQSQLRNPPVHRCFAGLRGAAAGIGGTAYNATNRTTKQTIAAPRPGGGGTWPVFYAAVFGGWKSY